MEGGFIIQRHNEIREITANLFAEVCKDVAVEVGVSIWRDLSV